MRKYIVTEKQLLDAGVLEFDEGQPVLAPTDSLLVEFDDKELSDTAADFICWLNGVTRSQYAHYYKGRYREFLKSR